LSGAGPVALAVAVLASVVVIAVGIPKLANPAVPDAGRAIGYKPPPAPETIAFLGDSYTSGSAMGGNDANGYPSILAAALGWPWDNDGEGGSGYTVPGLNHTTFLQRVPRVVRQRPDVVVVWGARNDLGQPLGALRTAVTATLSGLRSGLPHAKIVVIGPASPTATPPPGMTAMRDVERSVAAKVGVPFVDPIAEHWLDNPKLVGGDGVHPNDAGHRHIAAMMLADLRRLRVVPARTN
jgi:lysophospholipase L1-like esterase